MRREDTYFRQRVTEAELDEMFDDTENGLWNLAIDIGLLGVVTGGVITETGTPSWNVLASNPLRAYDQLGRRLYFGSQQTIDCEEDENGNPTIPSASKERYLMLKLEFTRLLSDLRQDGNGANVYYIRDEYFEINVEMGAEATYGNGVKPTKPSDSLVLCDILIKDSHTDIQNADIDFLRKDAFLWTTADKIGVTSAGWTKIDSAVTEAQSALDSVDVELISRESDGDIGQHLLPKDNTLDLGAAANVWGEGHVTDQTIYNTLKASADQKVLGTAAERFNGHFYDQTIYNAIVASADGKKIGDATNRFEGSFTTIIVYTKIAANAGGEDIGDATNQFDAFLSSATLYGTLADRLKFSAAKQVTILANINDFLSVGGTDWAWSSTRAYVSCSVSAKIGHFYFSVPHGVSLDQVRIRWSQAAIGAGGMAAQIESIDEDNAASNVGGSKTITTTDGSTNWDVIATGLAEAVDLATTAYRVKVTTVANAVVHNVYKLEIRYDVTDILKAALYSA